MLAEVHAIHADGVRGRWVIVGESNSTYLEVPQLFGGSSRS